MSAASATRPLVPMAKRKRSSHRTSAERALDEIYAEIPQIPDCDGSCADACGPIAMFRGEWDRVKRSFGRTPRLAPGSMTCPMLSPTGKCMVYTVRPYICRLWGATPGLRCPRGCKPERWLTRQEAQDIFDRIAAIAGPEVTGPLGSLEDLWAGIGLEAREARAATVDKIRKAVHRGSET